MRRMDRYVSPFFRGPNFMAKLANGDIFGAAKTSLRYYNLDCFNIDACGKSGK